MASSSHYERLKVAEQASDEDIRAAWQAEVDRQRHLASQSPIAQAVALADIHAAYAVLSDRKRRAHYDKKLAACRGAEADPAAHGLPRHSANDEDAAGPAPRVPAAAPPPHDDATAASLRMAESLGGMLTQLGQDLARPRLWPSSPGGMAAVTVVAALLGAWLALSADSTAYGPAGPEARAHLRRLSPQARQAHAQWLVTARTASHPLDGEPLRLRR
jgi:curved DNA-binding protein CbpA